MVDLFCIASGPSLSAPDCDIVKKSGIKTVAVNNSWEMATFCDYIYAGDTKWWTINIDKINTSAERWTCSIEAATMHNINHHIAAGAFNSGMRAIQFGIMKGFKNIALLGYDCSIKNGIHWHGPHSENKLKNPTIDKVKKWHDQFKLVFEQAKKLGVKVINCSRYTELQCFERVTLEDAIGEIK